jgi:hypothetical protein
MSSPYMIVCQRHVVGQQKAYACRLEQVVVDRFELMRQRIDAGD